MAVHTRRKKSATSMLLLIHLYYYLIKTVLKLFPNLEGIPMPSSSSNKSEKIKQGKAVSVYCYIFWPAFGCCAPQKLVEIFIFSIYCAKKLKKWEKSRKFEAKFIKKHIFFNLHQNAGRGLFFNQTLSIYSKYPKMPHYYSVSFLHHNQKNYFI